MSTMAVKHTLTTARKAAVTAKFSVLCLPFIKYPKVIVNCRGTFRINDLFLFFMFAHDLAKAYFAQSIFANTPNIMRLNPQERDAFLCSLLSGGLNG